MKAIRITKKFLRNTYVVSDVTHFCDFMWEKFDFWDLKIEDHEHSILIEQYLCEIRIFVTFEM